MASPLLEAGAIDGARGILINITGSSSLKLSEVNQASSLIQSAAHEDANIIFGAVQDEKMGEEVKITVIATGFRDQMPERRARMLSVEESPVVSVPVVAPDNWFEEPAAASAPAPARFLSQDEEEAAEAADADAAFFFSASTPAVATTVSVAAPPAGTAVDSAMKLEPDRKLAPAAARAQFDKMAEEPSYTPLPRDYAAEFDSGPYAPVAPDEHRAQPATALFSEPDEESLRELDTPTFMRRLQF
jgi:cell division protein FtsZ